MNENNYCIIMAGGFGSRFWPLCDDDNPKQFIDILGNGESMLQSTFHRFERICPRENIIIVTSERYAERVRQQVPGLAPHQVLSEPMRRNTAPCIAYAAAVIADRNPNANIIVTPSDHAIFGAEAFEHDIRQALELTEQHDFIVTIGVRPTDPNTKYGYIQFSEEAALPEAERLHSVVTFTEKPPVEMARQFIATGEFFWNAGIFVWSLPTLRRAYDTYLPGISSSFFALNGSTGAEELARVYSMCETISVDFGIMEKADHVFVLEASFGWSDVESWDSLYATYPLDSQGNAVASGRVFAYDVKDSVVHVPNDCTVILQGLDGYIVAGSGRTLLVCKREEQDRIIKFASDVELAAMMNQMKEEK